MTDKEKFEKAKRYDEAVERAKEQLDKAKVFDYKEEQIAHDIRTTAYAIFPELKESDDERIRKELIFYFQEEIPQCSIQEHADKMKEFIAWLEKGEQNPAWSEEDEVKINRIVACLENLNVADNDILLKDVDWLKSLKDRVQPQPKQEWSEEDEMFVHGLIRGLAAKRDIHGHTTFSSDCIDITETINWLKSLRPQNRWKPSESDILLLERIASGESNPQDFQASLGGLIGQLKKLK